MSDINDLKDKTSSHKKLLETSHELKQALGCWEDLCKQAKKPSADEQMLLEIKGLLSKLKSQIEDFK